MDFTRELREIRAHLSRAVDRLSGSLSRPPVPEHAALQDIRDGVAAQLRALGRVIEPEV